MKNLAAGLLLLTLAGAMVMAQEGQTLKERLSDKASDMQRVNNCGVPVERRGITPRPDCSEKTRSPATAAEMGAPAAPGPR